ncbi:GNAT family N-acetyltransferase [Sphingobacterium suaedae]
MSRTLAFEKYTREDFPLYKDLVSEDQIMKYISGKGLTIKQARKKFDSILEINTDPVLGYFKVIDLASGLLLGDCKLVNYKKDPSLFEIGYLLRSEFWRQGLGTKICQYLLALSDSTDNRKDVVGIIDPENIASRQLLLKFGFQRTFIGTEDGIATEKLIRRQAGAS